MRVLPKEIIDYIAGFGGTPEGLTQEEIDAVIEEYEAIKNGGRILDGVLFGRFPLYR